MTTEQEAELERTTRLRGFRYGLHDFLAELDLHALKAVNDHVEADYVNESLLDRRTKELLIISRWTELILQSVDFPLILSGL